ncbi:hypothetical protein AVEN_78199-1 [Araneus ventricosus]|uniref:Uncharacterized protein n=1 Tax=Araneus ventricosus TaxID=182803 RepID=A0A4Y2R643_ARAVE|nr:hypothetical protein AVEN_78199-1 [Araneus ventricosus]
MKTPQAKRKKTKGKKVASSSRFQLISNLHQMDELKEKDRLLVGIDFVGRDKSEEAVTETDGIEIEVAVCLVDCAPFVVEGREMAGMGALVRHSLLLVVEQAEVG